MLKNALLILTSPLWMLAFLLFITTTVILGSAVFLVALLFNRPHKISIGMFELSTSSFTADEE